MNLKGFHHCFFVLFLICGTVAIHSTTFAQVSDQNDTIQAHFDVEVIDTVENKSHSPHKATLYSAVLPGLGQAYNKKYWKIPIIYAGFGVFYYLVDYNNDEYQLWRNAYYHALTNEDGSEPPVNDYEAMFGDNTNFLRDRKNSARRYRDLNYILMGIWYMINVVDAAVDAHLFNWNVDDDLSLKIEPHIHNQYVSGFKPSGGLKLSLRF